MAYRQIKGGRKRERERVSESGRVREKIIG